MTRNARNRNAKIILFILAIFVVVAVVANKRAGLDISASYISCKLMMTGQASHLYAYDPVFFNQITDPEWTKIATGKGFFPGAMLTPFVQTPLWPFILRPLCANVYYTTFIQIFAVILVACFAAMIWLTGRRWAPHFFVPLWVLVTVALWVRSDPLRRSLLLTQTHAIFLLLTLIAILWARAGRPIGAGVALALAAAVKITPGALVVYWLVTRQKKAAASFIGTSIVLAVVTFLIAGRDVMVDYLHSMTRTSNVLLLADANQSFAAWWLGHTHPISYISYPLPHAMKLACLALILLSVLLGGWIDRRLTAIDPAAPAYGAVFALLGATMFTPIAWTHYYIVLIVPFILLLDDSLRRRSTALLALLAAMFLMANATAITRGLQFFHLPSHDILRSSFYAGVMGMAGMLVLYQRRKTESLAR